MTHTIEQPKWILYRHTNNFDQITAVAVNLQFFSKTSISKESKKDQLLELRELGYYKERNPKIPLDAITHRINTLEYYMFGYKSKVHGKDRFLFNPLGNLFLKHIKNKSNLTKIFFSMLWGVQFPNRFGTDPSFKIFPFRLIFKLLHDSRLEHKLFAFEVAYHAVFEIETNSKKYEDLVERMLDMRKLPNEEIVRLFKDNEHVLVNAIYEWDYYVSTLLVNAGVLDKTEGETICTLNHGEKTLRKLTRNSVTMSKALKPLYLKLENRYPFTQIPITLRDSDKLSTDVIKEMHSFFPEALLEEINEIKDEIKIELLKLPQLIEQYAENDKGKDWDRFENVLEKGFNSFYNVDARKLSGPGRTDVECLYITERKKFAVDGKSTKNKLTVLSAGRLAEHRDKINAEYTIVITPRYVPSVLSDIRGSQVVIISASTFSEYLYHHFDNDLRDIDYADFHETIVANMGSDISGKISDLTIEKFASRTA